MAATTSDEATAQDVIEALRIVAAAPRLDVDVLRTLLRHAPDGDGQGGIRILKQAVASEGLEFRVVSF